MKMFFDEAKDKGTRSVTTTTTTTMPTSQSSSESDQKRERIESYKDARRRELSTKYGPRQDPMTTKSFKATRKKEDLRGGGGGGGSAAGPFLKSYLNSQYPENQVPLSDSRRYLPRRDLNKTDTPTNEDPGAGDFPGPTVLVRETKASRLRAATRTPTSDAASPKPRDARRQDKERTPSSGSPISGLINRKDVDKSHSRKSHLNRSHTSEGVYDDIYSPAGSNIRRRGVKNSSLESSPAKGDGDKDIPPRTPMGNSNGSPRDSLDTRTTQIPRSPLYTCKKTPASSILEKYSFNSRKRLEERKLDSDGLTLTQNGKHGKMPVKTSPERSLLGDKRTSGMESPARRISADRSKQIDIAARAEILAASTLKMINRLDEINSKAKRNLENSERVRSEDSNKKVSSVVSYRNTSEMTPEVKKIPLQDEFSIKSVSSTTKRNPRPESKGVGSKVTDVSRRSPKSEKHENKARYSIGKPSILKNKPWNSAGASEEPSSSKPVSILKRKSLSQDETRSSSPPPVTFSPSVLKKETDAKKQGILKKRRSLDESEVMRRRSYSPDASYSDFKSILKNQRRSSMEELTRRSYSPDSTPQGILKRKSSREEDPDEGLVPVGPQGILKRKSLPCLNTHQQHVKISESTVSATVAGDDTVRPILKKKSSSEEYSASDLSLTEVPKSILKKKSSLEADEGEEKPKKPILKSSRMSSLEDPEEGKKPRGSAFDSPDDELVRPILKRENSKSALEGLGGEDGVVLRRVRPKRQDRPYSSSDIDSELSAIFLKRRSLEFQPIGAINFNIESDRPRKTSSNDKLRGDVWRRPLSVAEKITNLENFLEVERMERERRNSPPGASSRGNAPPPIEGILRACSSLQAISTKRCANSLILPLQQASASSPASRFDLTLIGQSESPVTSPPILSHKEAVSSSTLPFASVSPSDVRYLDLDLDLDLEALKQPETNLKTGESSESFGRPEKERLLSRTSFHSTDSELISASASKSDDTGCYFSVDSCGDRLSSLTLNESSNDSSSDLMEGKDSDELYLLRRTGSVSARTSLFKDLEKKFKADAEDEKVKKIQKGSTTNAAINRRHVKKALESNTLRYHTQPVSTEEVELAVRKSRSTNDHKGEDEGENHEDELSAMSYLDRLRLFESTFTPQSPGQSPRKRATRFRTQPVTTDEVETAKNQRLSSQTQQPDQNVTGSGAQSSPLRPQPSKPAEEKSKPKGILKNLSQYNMQEGKEDAIKATSESDSSDLDKKGILKSELSESLRNLKKVLREAEQEEVSAKLKGILKSSTSEKKPPSSSEEEEDGSASKRGRAFGANLAAILQRVEQVPTKSIKGGQKKGQEEQEEEEGKEGNSSRVGMKGKAKYVKNAGIAREINKIRNSSAVLKSQSHSSVSSVFCPAANVDSKVQKKSSQKSVPSDGDDNPFSRDEADKSCRRLGGLRRSTTQPLGSADEGTDDDMSGASIQERLARLKRSGELDWQKRKSHVTNLEDELSVITAGNYLFNENCLLRDQNSSKSPQTFGDSNQSEDPSTSLSILADRLGKLDAAKDGWKKRIKPSDAVRFSVEGKMMEKMESLSPPNVPLQTSPTRTPLAERKKRSPKAARFRSKQAANPSLSSVPSSPLERIDNPIARSVSAPGGGKHGLFGLSVLGVTNGPVVTVPKNDDETFTSFFEGLSTERMFQERLEIKDEDLDVVTRMKSSQLLVQKRNIKTQKRRATVRNPVKALAARLDHQEYTEMKTGIAEMELKRMKIEKASKNSNLAIEALAGLASQEDFTAINLKKASESGTASPDAPYKDLMLMQVKGRRHVQTRLVEPTWKNINAGDCFILVTPDRLFNYVGEFANVIEKSRAAEISSHVHQKGDLGCSASSVITIGEGGRATQEQIKEFWQLLGGDGLGPEREAGNVDEDEHFESALVDTNMVYEVVEDELVPNDAFWGSIPKIEILDPNKVLVFDFGSEFYVWNGKNVNLSQRKVALKLAKELWAEGFDYTDCDVCPLTFPNYVGGGAETCEEVPDSKKAGPARPGWALFAKITQNMETVLFREKFLDWPDYSRVIRRNKKSEGNEQGDPSATLELKPCDAKEMLENVVSEPDLVLEGNHLGRGIRYFDEESRRCSEITTQDVTVWHVREYEYSEVRPKSVGQFHMEDSYVVRWHYVITITGRELGGQPSKHLTTGRNRYAYFFWQGNDSPINDKGAAACLTVELDKEHGPQIRVVQGLEPPAFVNLFQGKMAVHRGRRSSDTPCDNRRLFICRGETETESVLFEVPCSMRNLRSVASFLLVDRQRGKIVVWHGWKSLEHTKKVAVSVAEHVRSQTPDEFEFETDDISIAEETEGKESQEFIRALGGDNRHLYYSLDEDKTSEVKTPRLFHLTSVSGEFVFSEVASPYLSKESTTPFPFLQSDLYAASQPALFMMDAGDCLWLWQGWWEENSESDRGSGYRRFQAERRAAMSTAMSYWSLKHGNLSPKAFLIWAGLEPLIFTNLFPFWKDRDDIAEINMKDGRKPGEAVPVKTEFASLTQSTYPLAQLQNRPLPDGVNPTTLEDYLEPQCFPELFGIDKEDFVKMPSWKKKKLKQEVGLF